MEINRDYYSWSQHSLWKSSKLQFYKRYVLGETGPKLLQFDKGKEFADYRETGELPHWVDDPLIKTVADIIPRIGHSEMKIEVGFGDIKLLAYLDECQEDLTHFFEFKTGKIPWDQIQVNAHKQLDFYALCVYLHSGETIIPSATLYWIETEEYEREDTGDKALRYTGFVQEFHKQFTQTDIENIAADVYQTYNEIKNYVHEELTLEDSLVDRYLELLEQEKAVKNELDLIKLQVLDELNSFGAKYAATPKGRFSISERKIPIYSPELLIKEKQYKDEIDTLKKAEKDSPTMKYEISESLRFTPIKSK